MNLKLKEKKCRQCKEKFLPVRTLQMVCTLSCAMKYAKVKEEEKDRKAWIKRKKDLREKLKTLGEYEKEAKAVFQKWIRQRDKKLPCISCGKVAENYDGGHFFKAELYSGLIFNEDNCNKQCVYCNQHLHGNESNYRIGLVKKIGEERVKWLEENKDRLRTYKYTKEQLIEIKKEYQQRLKEL
jgi:hypothetical protein